MSKLDLQPYQSDPKALTAQKLQFCGVSFHNENVESLVQRVFRTGGDVLVPAAPAFANILDDAEYHTALRDGNYVIFDSGLLALLCALKYRRPISRISGLRLLDYMFLSGGRRLIDGARILWVVPDELEAKRIEDWIGKLDFERALQSFYIAPMYRRPPDFSDQQLVVRIAEMHPDVIIVCIGGGGQEKLAWNIKRMMPSCPPIICTGAAISFLTGSQAHIPKWVDRACMGWLWRILDEPKKFGPRYGGTLWNLPRMLWHYHRMHGSLN